MKEIARWSREEVDALLHAWREGLTQKPAPLRRGKLNAYVSARFQALRDGHEPFRTACSIVYKKKYWKSMAQFICEYNAAQHGLDDTAREMGNWFALSQDERKHCFSELKTTSYKFTDLEQDTVFEIAKLIAIEDGAPDMSRMVYASSSSSSSSSSSLLRDGGNRGRYASGSVGGTTPGAGGYSSRPSSADYNSSSGGGASRPQQPSNEPTYHRAYSPAANTDHSLLPVRSSFVHATTGPMTHLPTASNNSFLRSSPAAARKRPTVLIDDDDDDDDTMTSSDDDEAFNDAERHSGNAPSKPPQQRFLQVLSKRKSSPLSTAMAASPRDVRELHDNQQQQSLPPGSPSPPFTLAGQSRREAAAAAAAAAVAAQGATPDLMKIVDRLEIQAQELKAMVHQEREARKQAREQHGEQQKAWQREQEAHQQVLDLLKSSQQASLEIQRTRQSEHAEWAKVLEQLQLDREERARLQEARRKDQEERKALLEEMKKSQAEREQMLAEWEVEREERAKLLEQVQQEKEAREQDEKEWRALLKQMKAGQEFSREKASQETPGQDQSQSPSDKVSKQDHSEKPSSVPTSASKPSDSQKDHSDEAPKTTEVKPVKSAAAVVAEADVASTVKEGAEVLRVLRQLAVPPPAVAVITGKMRQVSTPPPPVVTGKRNRPGSEEKGSANRVTRMNRPRRG